ncbi:MAG TPA: MoaD/ThiS family protein [Caulobacteraceae bacterium]
MVRVTLACSDCRLLAGGVSALDVEADTVGRMIAELDRRHPGLGEQIRRRAAIAIDGEIHQDALAVPLSPGSEVYLIPRIGGG